MTGAFSDEFAGRYDLQAHIAETRERLSIDTRDLEELRQYTGRIPVDSMLDLNLAAARVDQARRTLGFLLSVDELARRQEQA